MSGKPPSSNGFCSKTSKRINKKFPNVEKFELSSTQRQEKYLVLKRPVKIEGRNSSVKVAFQLGKNKRGREIIVPEKDSKLMAFFPTEKETFLDFLLQGPYVTTPGRDNISEDEDNERIVLETGKLVAESLPIVRELGYLSTDFLRLLPLDSSQTDDIYSVLYDRVKNKLLSGKFLLDWQGKYTTPGKAVLADGRGLTEFLNKTDLNELFSRTTWLDTGITSDRTPELRRYLINELEVEEINFRNFASEITEEFLKRKSDRWMADFYNRLLGQKTLWDRNGTQSASLHYGPILNAKPIIRLNTKSDTGQDEHIAPFDADERRQVHLPTEPKSSDYKTVKEVFVNNKGSRKFLNELGIREPDIHAEVIRIISKYRFNNSISIEEGIGDFKKILQSYNTIRADEKGQLIRKLSGTPFILAINGNTGKKHFLNPSGVYLPNYELQEFFKGHKSVYFVASELLEEDRDGTVTEFLKGLGAEDKPRLNNIRNLTYEETEELRDGGEFTREEYEDYMLSGLENFFQSEVTPERSHLLWEVLLKSIEGMTYGEANSLFMSTYRWRYYGWHSTNFETRLHKALKRKWLIDKNGELRRPSHITFDELAADYITENSNADVLGDVLFPKIEDISETQKTENLVQKAFDAGVPREKVNSVIEALIANESNKVAKWKPDVKSDEVSPQIPETKSYSSNNIELRVQVHDKVKEPAPVFNPAEQLDNFDETEEESQNESLVDKKAIGKWSEDVVYKALKEKYGQRGEVIWLNENGPGGDHRMGYDMRVEENSSVIMYIEVKGTTQSDPKSIEVQGTQWALARKLYERGEGEKYYFYVVSGAGTNSVEITPIKNPYGGWIDGWLQAHPVRIKLPKNTPDNLSVNNPS